MSTGRVYLNFQIQQYNTEKYFDFNWHEYPVENWTMRFEMLKNSKNIMIKKLALFNEVKQL